MARKKKQEEHENHERWLVSYADFITLLFAFFVVMYSISSVNEGKYRVLSDSLVSAFKNTPSSLNPVQIGKVMRSPTEHDSMMQIPESNELKQLKQIRQEMRQAIGELVDLGVAEMRMEDEWLEIDIKSNILFLSGQAELQTSAEKMLSRIAQVLKRFPNPLQVEGFTDNIPINNGIYPSNWELSASRAASVVHLFMKTGVSPYQMSAIGYGEYRPRADNNTEEGRQQNRRVVIVVLAHENIRRFRKLIQDSAT